MECQLSFCDKLLPAEGTREVGSRVVVLHVVVQSVLGLEQLTTLRALKHMDINYIFSRNMNFY